MHNPKIQFFIFCLFVILPIASFCQPNNVQFCVTYEPQNPAVGELVTFSISPNCLSDISSENAVGPPVSICLYHPAACQDGCATTNLFPAANTQEDPIADYIENLEAVFCPPENTIKVIWPAKYTYTYSQPGEFDIYYDCKDCTSVLFKGNITKNHQGVKIGTISVGTNIPTLSEWGLIILSLLLMILGALSLRSVYNKTV